MSPHNDKYLQNELLLNTVNIPLLMFAGDPKHFIKCITIAIEAVE